jgi:HEPN domain-containing protein
MHALTVEWVEKAEGDYGTAGRELTVQPQANYDAVCFHAQQTAEIREFTRRALGL